MVTITLAAEATYNISADETITVTVPATAVAGVSAIVASPTFAVTAAVGSASVSGTIIPSVVEGEIVAGGKTLILTLSNETWDAAIGADNAQTTDLINGIDSAQSEATGWDA